MILWETVTELTAYISIIISYFIFKPLIKIKMKKRILALEKFLISKADFQFFTFCWELAEYFQIIMLRTIKKLSFFSKYCEIINSKDLEKYFIQPRQRGSLLEVQFEYFYFLYFDHRKYIGLNPRVPSSFVFNWLLVYFRFQPF